MSLKGNISNIETELNRKQKNIMDSIDLIILQELLKDCKKPIKQIAQKVNLSITPVHERIKRMESSGVIQRYSAIIQPEELDLKLIVLMQIKLKDHKKDVLKNLEVEIKKFGEILEAYFIAGDYDVFLKVILTGMDDYNDFVLERISTLTQIDSIKSSFAMKNILHEGRATHLMTPTNVSVLKRKKTP